MTGSCYRAVVAIETSSRERIGSTPTPMPISASWLGRVEYREALALQKRLAAERAEERIGDQLLLLEHPAVLTLGRTSDPAHIRADPAVLAARGIEVVRVERGGEVTYHGPGQLVGYPILDLPRLGSDILRHIRGLEQSLIACLAGLGMASEPGGRGMTGVWSRGAAAESRPLEKVAAIGVKLNQRVTNHGFALNLTSDLSIFNEGIVPCGLAGKRATSLLALGGPELATADAARAYTPHFGGAFDVDVEWGEASELWALPPAPAPEPRNLLALVPRA